MECLECTCNAINMVDVVSLHISYDYEDTAPSSTKFIY